MAQTRTVLITGAARRVGAALALSFAEEKWDVAIHYHRSLKEAQKLASVIKGKGGKAWLVEADLRDAKAVAGIIRSLEKQRVKLDCLINNAAAFEKDSLATLAPAHWHTHMDTNLFAPLLLMQGFAAHYKGNDGNIINITDGLYGWSMSPSFLSYCLSKQGLGFATKMLARELAPDIRVNAIAPGATLMSKYEKEDTFTGSRLKKTIPLARASSPEEICNAAHYILSSPSLTGQTLSLSGGADCL